MKRFILILVVILAVCAVVFGWISFDADEDSASMTLDTERVKEDTKAAVDTTNRAVQEAVEEVRETPKVDADVDVDVQE
ncbi:MAG: hypothetical protein CMJ46_01595 [Planctomyces sp.]|nr:hypothetical protein [Planctomyces sp.]